MPHDPKQPLSITILSHTYQVVPQGDPAELLEAAEAVHQVMEKLAKARNLDTQRAAVFAALHFAQKHLREERELQELKKDIEFRGRKISSMLDHIVNGQATD